MPAFAVLFAAFCLVPAVWAKDKTAQSKKEKEKISVEETFPEFPTGVWLQTKPLTESFILPAITDHCMPF